MSSQSDLMIDLTEANFADVVGRSRQIPVLVDFWADWCAPCKQIAPVLEKLARELKGKLLVAKVNADREPLVTQQFGVRGLPTLKLIVQGQLAGELVGAQPEAAIRQWLAPFLAASEPESPAEDEQDFHGSVLALLADGHFEEAAAALTARLAEDKNDHRAREMLAEILVQESRLDEAAELLSAADAVPELKRARALLAFARRTDGIPSLHALELQMAADAGTETRYRYALRLVTANRLPEGLDMLLQVMRADRQYGEDAARKSLLEVFDMLGRDDPLTVEYRRRMASMLY